MKSIYIDNTYAVKFRLLLFLMLGMLIQQTEGQVSTWIDAGITTDITGDITIESNGDWLNQGSLFPGNSTLILQGPFTLTLQQDGGSLYNIILNKSGGDVLLGGNINVNKGTLSVMQQDLSLNGHMIIFDSTAQLSETSGHTVKGPSGYITTTRHLAAPMEDDIAGFGIGMISDDDFGYTEIRRGHAPQSANAAQGILRYFDVFPEFDQDQEADLVFHYDESELNGNTESGLQLFRSPDGGINWVGVPGSLNIVSNTFEATAVNAFSRFTLSSYCLETCIATMAKVKTTVVYLNSAGLAYLLADAVNDGSKGACGIDTMYISPEVFTCDDVGSKQVTLTVRDHHGCENSASVSIDVVDNIAPDVYCKNISLQLHQSCLETITPADIDNGSADACGITRSINVSSFNCSNGGPNNVILTVTDPSGNSASCTAVVTVLLPVSVICQEATLNIGAMSSITINPYDLLVGPPGTYAGFTFVVVPATLYCDQLGGNSVTITGTDPFGEVTVCQTTIYLDGPDSDCDGVSNACDVCNGGDDQLDTDGDGIPNCADWDGWSNLIPAWQCANNKVFVCHNNHVNCINQNAVQAHLNHGDFLGPCDAANCDNPGFAGGNIGSTTSDVGVNIEGSIVSPQSGHTDGQSHIMAENFPNPFYPETMIRYYLPEKQWMSLSVFDMNGQPVVLLAKGVYDAGWHQVIFDGSTTADGIYCYRLQTQHDNLTRTMVLDSK